MNITPRGLTFKVRRPQQLAALLLVVFLLQCCRVIKSQHLNGDDYRYARCGREMWEKPSPLTGYFTTCGNLNGEGTFAYRLAGFPLTVQRLFLLSMDSLRSPDKRLYSDGSLNGSTWEARHEITYVLWLVHLPFVFMAAWLGGGLWWVSRRLFGNEGGFLSLAMYVFNPQIVRYAVVPNNEVLAMWGLYGVVYTAIGVAHAMQGPPRKWKPRVALLTLALGLTATAHLLAAMVGFLASLALMFYLALGRRSAALLVATYSAVGAALIIFAFYSFRLPAFTYVFTGGAARFWFGLEGLSDSLLAPEVWPLIIAAAISLFVYVGLRRSRYFGNTTPLLIWVATSFLVTTQVRSAPALWALPFLITFVGGVFADALESSQRRLYIITTGLLTLTQAIACWGVLPFIAKG